MTKARSAAKIARLEPKLGEAIRLLELADKHEVELLKLDIAKRNLQEAILWQSQMTRKARMLTPPTVIVMGVE